MNAVIRHMPEPLPFTRTLREGGAVIRVVGVGGAGSNAVARMVEDGIGGVEFIVANTDAQALSVSPVGRRVRLGEALTRGLGAGGDPTIGARAAQESLEELRALLRGSDMIFVTAGMGGGTGTGAAPIVARLAHELGALTVAVVSSPFLFEGPRRSTLAAQGIETLRPHVDTLIVVPNERLLHIVDPHLPFTDALRVGDEILRHGVRGISDLITTPGLINLDFADVRSIIAGAGSALMAIGEAGGDRRAQEATQRAIESPLLERDIRGANRILLNISGGADLTLMEIHTAATQIQALAHPDAVIIFGTVQDEALNGRMRVTLIATSFSERVPAIAPPTGVAAPIEAALHTTAPATEDWPTLPFDAGLTEEPTIALPALTSLRPPVADVREPIVPVIEPDARPQRTVESAWQQDHPQGADVYDVPAFLRRHDTPGA